MINDGYGDDDQWFEEKVKESERLLQVQVSERNRDPDIRDDLINEARLEVWRMLQKQPDATNALIFHATGQRINELRSRQTWTGHTGVRGKAIDPLRREDRDSLDDPDWPIEVVAHDVLDQVLSAYHDGEILDAIRSLPLVHQEYVMLRFWGGYTNVEIAAMRATTPSTIDNHWMRQIRPRLVERLGHLVGM